MLSWKLWQALKNPPYLYPLMRRIHADAGWLSTLRDIPRPYLYAILLAAAYILWRILPYAVGYVFLLIVALPAVATLLFLISPLLFPLVMVGAGTVWAANISDRVLKQQERGIYDLLCVIPGGRWAANWLTASSTIHQGGTFKASWIMLGGVAVVGLVLLLTLFSLVLVGQFFSAGNELSNFGWLMLDMIVLFMGQLLHHIQTMALSPLVGLLIPTYIHNRAEARLSAVGLYLGLQLIPYLFCGLLFYLAPLVASEPVDAGNSLTPYLLVLFGLREAIIMLLWIVLLWRLKLVADEKKHLWTLLQ
jgi:hypothetical protein